MDYVITQSAMNNVVPDYPGFWGQINDVKTEIWKIINNDPALFLDRVDGSENVLRQACEKVFGSEPVGEDVVNDFELGL